MSDQQLQIKITTEADLRAAKETEKGLCQQVIAAQAAGVLPPPRDLRK